jgi:hypothetical protein
MVRIARRPSKMPGIEEKAQPKIFYVMGVTVLRRFGQKQAFPRPNRG